MKRMFALAISLGIVISGVGGMGGCSAKKVYPDPDIGSHTADYSVIFGRLQRVMPANPDNPPVWVVRFGIRQEPYGGELALTPADRLLGYTGGEMVQVRGRINPSVKSPDYPGNWYEISAIRLWVPHD